MNGNQKIHCTVGSCKYNNTNENMCALEAINVTPIQNCQTKKQMNPCVQVTKTRRNKISSRFLDIFVI